MTRGCFIAAGDAFKSHIATRPLYRSLGLLKLPLTPLPPQSVGLDSLPDVLYRTRVLVSASHKVVDGENDDNSGVDDLSVRTRDQYHFDQERRGMLTGLRSTNSFLLRPGLVQWEKT